MISKPPCFRWWRTPPERIIDQIRQLRIARAEELGITESRFRGWLKEYGFSILVDDEWLYSQIRRKKGLNPATKKWRKDWRDWNRLMATEHLNGSFFHIH